MLFQQKANPELFAGKLAAKYKLILEEHNQYSDIVPNAHVQLSEPAPPEETAANILRCMKKDSATGPDMLLMRVLKKCGDVLAKPFKIMALLIFHQGVWLGESLHSIKAQYSSRGITVG